jgi:hypothetical protein
MTGKRAGGGLHFLKRKYLAGIEKQNVHGATIIISAVVLKRA